METEFNSSPLAELLSFCAEPRWFCLRTHLKREHIAAAHLRRMPGVDVFNPQVRLLRSTRRGRRWSTESLFPNYIFARFILDSLLEKVSYTPAVKFVLRFGGRVPQVPDTVIEHLRLDLLALDSQVLTDAPAAGDEVEVGIGAFVGTKAVIAHVLPGKQRARILIEVMGRSVPAELSLDLVLFNRRRAAEIALKQAAETALKHAETACVSTISPAIALGEAKTGLGDAAANGQAANMSPSSA
jgi:transcriptional antiterminator RfaH